MPTSRQSLIAFFTRFYPLYSGCGTLANHALIQKLAGSSDEEVWARVTGGKLLAPLNDYDGIAAFYVGVTDRKVSWVISNLVRPGNTVLDIGTNIGVISLLLSSLVGPQGRVHAFEPNPNMQRLLGKSLRHNKISNVNLYPIALGANNSVLQLNIPKGHTGRASLARQMTEVECDKVTVDVRTLDEFSQEIKLQAIDFIKIDVEGFELEVFKGAGNVIQTLRPKAILFEFDDTTAQPLVNHPIFSLLNQHGYRFLVIPKCVVNMHLQALDISQANQPKGHDYLAVANEYYDVVAKLLRVT